MVDGWMDLEDDGPRRGTIRVRVKNREESKYTDASDTDGLLLRF